MAILQITAFVILIMAISYKEKKTFVEAVPVAVCILVLILYGLSFVNGLLWSDYLAIGAVAFTAFMAGRMSADRRKEMLAFLKDELFKPGTLIAAGLTLCVVFLVGNKVVTWWDDYNFWATDVKSIYFLNGFAGKYQNAAPEFGDYPPGTQMMKWWFLHMNPSEFKEGLLFAGYYFMNLAFLFPLLKQVKKRNFFGMLLGALVLWLFPTTVEVFGCDGCCADLTMAVIYGAFLAAVVDREGHSRRFYYGRQTLFLMVLMLCKNTGFLWVAFGLLFSLGYTRLTEGKERQKADRLGVLCLLAFPVITELSWLLFCLVNRRVAKLTGAALHMATGSMNIPNYQSGIVKSFFQAFVAYPLHRWKTPAIDLTPLAVFLLLLAGVFILYQSGRLKKKTGWFLGGFLFISGSFFYAVNLISHLTIFATETQYLEPYGMVSSIERYGAPFTIGGLYLIAWLLLNTKQKTTKAAWIICVLFVLLTADYNSAYRALIGYLQEAESEMIRREELVDEAAEEFLEEIGAGEAAGMGRVLYLRDISDISWVRNTYINFEAAPVSVMYGNIDGTSASSSDIVKAIEEAHADYLYADEIKGAETLFSTLTEEGSFSYASLYAIEMESGALRLKKQKIK